MGVCLVELVGFFAFWVFSRLHRGTCLVPALRTNHLRVLLQKQVNPSLIRFIREHTTFVKYADDLAD